MALPVLDGNQSATTLSSVVTGGEHIVAHSVVSLGSAAISNITSAVSGSVVSVSNFPASQSTTFGAVTGSVSVLNFPATQTIAGTVTAYGYNYNELFADPIPIRNDGNDQKYIPIGPSNSQYPSDSHPIPVINGGGSLTISGSVTVGNSVTIGSLPAITVTANVFGYSENEASYQPIPIVPWDEAVSGGRAVVVKVSPVDLPAANGYNYDEVLIDPIPIRNDGNDQKYIPIGPSNSQYPSDSHPIPVINEGGGSLTISGSVTVGNSVTIGSLPAISGTVTANLDTLFGSTEVYLTDADTDIKFSSANPFPISGAVTVGNSVTIGSLPAISGTVTVGAMPHGALTTRFGTPTTASSVFATSAVTNATRKYLLIQNVTTQSNVITVGIGFTPTTTQGIQLTAGAGITFESSYIPTGAVYVLSSVTASNFTILEA